MKCDVQFFELIVTERGGQRTLMRLPAARQAWGTFSRGELFRCEGRYYPIDQVINEFTSRQSAMLCSTILLVGPMLPESTLSDLAIPAAAALPEDGPAARDRGRRSWWGR